MQLIPFIQKEKTYKTMINRLGKQYKAYQNKYSKLKNEAIEEASKAHDLFTKRFEDYPESKPPELLKHLKEAEGYLSGEIPIYTPPHYVCAANSLASVCRILIQQENFELLEGLAEITYVNSTVEIDGIWQSTKAPCLKKCYFYNAISKLGKEQAKWSYESFDRTFVCWGYLQLAVKCWNLTGEDFEGHALKHQTLLESEKSNELLGLHGYWTELQAIRNIVL